jgi:hypothetical protein
VTAPSTPFPELDLLREFDQRLGPVFHSDGFELIDFGDVSYVDSWSAKPAFLERVLAFAQANGSGSVYALWRPDDGADLAKAPVVVFGDEGGVHVVARDIRDLLRLLTLDTEISVDWERAYFWREEEEHSPGHDRYLAWLVALGLLPADPDDGDEAGHGLLAQAQADFGPAFARWNAPFLTGTGPATAPG